MRFPKAPPAWRETLSAILSDASTSAGEGLLRDLAMQSHGPTTTDGRYLPWDELRCRTPPEGLSPEDFWVATKLARRARSVPIDAMTSVYADSGPGHAHAFSYTNLSVIQEALHAFDRVNVGSTLLSALGNEDAVTEVRVRQLIEESISSSEVEGARPTTREVARELVREGRPPTSRDERMIVNNWRAMQRIVELHAEDRPLDVDHLLELHRILGEDALDVPDAEGRFREAHHVVEISDLEGNVWYSPPAAEGVERRVACLLAFANGRDGGTFVHPVLRAIISHFWFAFEHPFRDGNGRMARAMFYWTLLRHGYEIAEFLSISGPIDRQTKKYALAFAHTETDEGDLTYFVLNQLDVLKSALDELLEHLRRRASAMKASAAIISGFDALNHRQRGLLQHAIRHPLSTYTLEGHARSHRVHYATAQRDFADLVERGFLESRNDGSKKRFGPSKKLLRKLATTSRGG